MTSKKGDCSMPMLEVKIQKFQLFFQKMAHGVRYTLQVIQKLFSTRENFS